MIYYIILISLFGLLLPAPFILPFFFLLLSVYAILSRNNIIRFIALFVSLIFTLLNWTYIGMGLNLWEWGSVLTITSIRALSLIYIVYFSYIFIFEKINIDLLIKILFTLVIFSFFKSSNLFIAFKYLVNVYAPFLFTLIFITNLNNIKKNNITKNIANVMIKVILVLILIDVYFILLDIFTIVDLKHFYLEVGSLFRGGAEGNNRTIIFNESVNRIAGIFADPIVAGYFLVLTFFYFFIKIKKNIFNSLVMIILLTLIVITVSKSSYIMLIIGFIGYMIYIIKLSVSKRIGLYFFIFFITLLLSILRATSNGVTDSSAIHVLGLILPFTNVSNINSYIVGHDLGSGGNMGGWVNEGAESFVGLLMYNTGIIGVMIYLKYIISFIKFSFKNRNLISKYLLIAILPVFWISFLQENSFNLSYSVPRLIFLILIALNMESENYDKKEVNNEK